MTAAPITATVWTAVDHPQGRRVSLSPAEVVERFRVPVVTTEKRRLAGWAPTAFRGDYRTLDRVELCFGIGLDLDELGTDLDVAVHALSGFAGFVYTSYRHAPERHRGRAIIWTSRPISASEYSACWRYVASRTPGAAQEAKDASRLWFVPGIAPGGEYRLVELQGAPLDVEDALSSERAAAVQLPTVAPAHVQSIADDLAFRLTRARRYLESMAPAISGSGGHAAAWRAALAMVRGFALPVDQALRLLVEDYNPRCVPPWSPKELEHKVASAAKSQLPPWLAETRADPWAGAVRVRVVRAAFERLLAKPWAGKEAADRVNLWVTTGDGEVLPRQQVYLHAREAWAAVMPDIEPRAWLDAEDWGRALAESLKGRELEIVFNGGPRAVRMRRAGP